MKMVTIIYDSEIDNQMMVILKRANVEKYTKIEDVRGVGSSGAKLNNPIGPGINSMVIVVVDDNTAESLKKSLSALKKSTIEKSGFKAIITPVEEFI
ncbi:MAG: PG0541 family transporter-associated protein [Nitrospirota bacterium]